MFYKYFESLESRIVKAPVATEKAKHKAGKEKEAAPPVYDPAELLTVINNIIPSNLRADQVSIVDSSGYKPEGVDFVIFKELFRDIVNIMDHAIPAELVYGTITVCPCLTRINLIDLLQKIIQIKKVNRFAKKPEGAKEIPAFVIVYESELSIAEIKAAVLDFYITRGIDFVFEYDILAVLNTGVIIKDWREKRNFIGLGTGKNTLQWLFVLMNEYLDVERGDDFDLRNYIQQTERYDEY